MAYTARDFHRDLAIFSAGGILGPTRSRKLLAYAARKGIQLAGFGARAALPLATTAAQTAAAPYVVGAGLGVGALGTPQGQDLLAAAAEHGRQSRILYERAQQELMTTPQRIEAAIAATGAGSSFTPTAQRQVVPQLKKRAVSKFNKAVSKGMKIVRESTSYGKKGKINNAKRAFAAVTKVVSLKKRKKKAPRSGIRAKIFRGIKGML
jgi:hypothetical protein